MSTKTCCDYAKKIIAVALASIAIIPAFIVDLCLSGYKTITAYLVQEKPKHSINYDLLTPRPSYPWDNISDEAKDVVMQYAIQSHLQILDANAQKLFLKNMNQEDDATLQWCALNYALAIGAHNAFEFGNYATTYRLFVEMLPAKKEIIFQHLQNRGKNRDLLGVYDLEVLTFFETYIKLLIKSEGFLPRCKRTSQKLMTS